MPSVHAEFTGYYKDYKHKVFSFLYYRLNGNRAIAEDLAADVFVKAYEKFDSYDRSYAFSTWIYTIARNTLIDYVRKEPEIVSEQHLEHMSASEDIQSEVDAQMNTERIEEVIALLPEFQKDCIVLKYLDGQNTKNIAAITGESEPNVRQALSRGIKKIQKYTSFLLLLLFAFFQS